MTKQMPAIRVFRDGNRFEAVAGYGLKSLLMGGLFRQSAQPGDHGKPDDNGNSGEGNLRAGREGLLRAMAAWGGESTLELKYAAFPDFTTRQRGRLRITLLLRASADSRAAARETAATECLSLRATLRTHMPEAEFAPITDSEELDGAMKPFRALHAVSIQRRREEIPLSAPFARRAIGLEAGMTRDVEEGYVLRHIAPWVPSGDGWERFIHMMMSQLDPVCAILRVRPAPFEEQTRLGYEERIRECELSLSGGTSYQVALKRQVASLRDVAVRHLAGLRRQAYSVGVFLLSPHPIDRALGCTLGNAITADQSPDRETGFFEGGYALSEIPAGEARDTGNCHDRVPFTVEEAACAFRLPSPPGADVPGLPLKRSRTALASMPRGGRRKDESALELFHSEHQQDILPVCIGADDRMRHMFILGQTGTGKSTLMEYMILQDIRAGRGVALIDPHGDLADEIVGKIPESRLEDVILLDLLDRGWPPGFNLLQWETIEERDLLIDELYAAVDHLYDMKQCGGPIFEMHFRGMLKLLMGNRKHDDFSPTLLDFVNCYLDKDFRHWLLARTDEPATCDFIREMEKGGRGRKPAEHRPVHHVEIRAVCPRPDSLQDHRAAKVLVRHRRNPQRGEDLPRQTRQGPLRLHRERPAGKSARHPLQACRDEARGHEAGGPQRLFPVRGRVPHAAIGQLHGVALRGPQIPPGARPGNPVHGTARSRPGRAGTTFCRPSWAMSGRLPPSGSATRTPGCSPRSSAPYSGPSISSACRTGTATPGCSPAARRSCPSASAP